uniref:DUF569 domain-containing protein n=1 Tax=Brassica campestris TaxID=3711 RepID=M4D7E4_BRACM
MPIQLDSSVEWEPVREGSKIMLRTRNGKYLRANSGPPPLRKSVTHNKRHSATQESISWEVDIVEILKNPLFTEEEMEFTPPPHRKPSKSPLSVSHSMTPPFLSDMHDTYPDESPSKSDGMESSPSSKKIPRHRKQSSNPFAHSDSDSDESPSKLDERTISYHFNHPLKVEMKSTPTSKKLPHSHYNFVAIEEKFVACEKRATVLERIITVAIASWLELERGLSWLLATLFPRFFSWL